MKKYLKNIGPGSVIAAAFIGPGTVTMCTIAGSQFGFALLWALLLSIVITIFLQTIAVRIGVIS
ncbi:MAG TPA: divalent metal cation transporter, partial [Candidatus Marinimicrobia bacterium]|nr:divalent metal cation transporter [Candidatus Neomarinimicrobiota bacterium]